MKKILSLIIVFIITVSATQIYASGNYISFNSAQKELPKNSRTLEKLRYNTYKAKIQYDSSVENSENLSIDTMRQIYRFMGRNFDSHTEMLLLKQRDLLPKQTKYYWEVSLSTLDTTMKSMVIGLRGVYLGLINADLDLKLKQKKLDLVQKKAEQNKKKYDMGLISKLDMEEWDYTLTKARAELEAAKRNKESASRSINKFMGVSLDNNYDVINYDESYNPGQITDINKYTEKALKDRAEIVNTQKEIELKQLEKSILEKNDVGFIYRDSRKDYSTILNEIESLKLKIEKSRLAIENEIKKAYIEIKKDENTIKNLKSTIEGQKRSLEKFEKLLKQGMTTQTVIDELQIGIEELENSYKLAVYNYNTKLMKLENAAGIGPAY